MVMIPAESDDNDHKIGYEYDDFITMTVIVLLMIIIVI